MDFCLVHFNKLINYFYSKYYHLLIFYLLLLILNKLFYAFAKCGHLNLKIIYNNFNLN